MTDPDELVDVRSKIEPESNRVLDAISLATGRDKSAVIREWISDRAKEELHKATVIVRVATRKGVDPA